MAPLGVTFPLIKNRAGRHFIAPPPPLTVPAADEDVLEAFFFFFSSRNTAKKKKKKWRNDAPRSPTPASMVTDVADVHSPIQSRE